MGLPLAPSLPSPRAFSACARSSGRPSRNAISPQQMLWDASRTLRMHEHRTPIAPTYRSSVSIGRRSSWVAQRWPSSSRPRPPSLGRQRGPWLVRPQRASIGRACGRVSSRASLLSWGSFGCAWGSSLRQGAAPRLSPRVDSRDGPTAVHHCPTRARPPPRRDGDRPAETDAASAFSRSRRPCPRHSHWPAR